MVRTVAIPIWLKHAIDVWMTAPRIDKGRMLRSITKSGKLNGDCLSDWAVWSIVERSSKQIRSEHFGAHDLRQTLPQERRGTSSRSSSCSAFPRFRQRSGIWGPSKRSPSL